MSDIHKQYIISYFGVNLAYIIICAVMYYGLRKKLPEWGWLIKHPFWAIFTILMIKAITLGLSYVPIEYAGTPLLPITYLLRKFEGIIPLIVVLLFCAEKLSLKKCAIPIFTAYVMPIYILPFILGQIMYYIL